MRPSTNILLVFILATFALQGQTIDFKIANESVVSGSPDVFRFEVQVKCDSSGTYPTSTQLYLNYNTGAFGTSVVTNGKVTVTKGALMNAGLGYGFVTNSPSDNTTSRFSIFTQNVGVDLGYDPTTNGSWFAQATSTYQTLYTVEIEISNSSVLPQISMETSLIDGGQYYVYGSSSVESKYTDEATSVGNSAAFPLHDYDIIWDGATWSGGGGTGNAPSVTDAANELLVQTGTTDPLPGDASVLNLIILDGGTLDLGGNTLTVFGSTMGTVNGSFTNGTVVYQGAAAQEIYGATNWDNLTINNTNGVTITEGTQNISGVLTPTLGTFTTNDAVKLIATSASKYGQIAAGTGTISGDVTFQMVIEDAGWHNLASPISGMTLADLEDNILVNYSGSGGGASAYKWNAGTGDWTAAAANTEAFSGGWNIYIDNNFVPNGAGVNSDGNLPVLLDLTGTPNTGAQTATLDYVESPSWSTFETDNGTGNDGWNLIANPYPSNIDWTQIVGAIPGTSNGYYYIWSPSLSAYVYHDGTIGHASRGETVPPMQAVWVKVGNAVDATTTAFNFTDAVRTTSNASSILKGNGELLRLTAEHSVNLLTDEVSIVREAGYSTKFDTKGDAIQRVNAGGRPNFFVISQDSVVLAIDRIAESFNGDTVKLGFTGEEAMNYTIAIETNDFPNDFDINLYDRKTGAVTDLKSSDYTFALDTAFGEHRFNLFAVSSSISVEENETDDRAFSIVQRDGRVILEFEENLSEAVTVEVVGLAGRVLYHKEDVSTLGDFTFTFTSPLNDRAYFIVRIIDQKTEAVYSQKVLL